MSEKKQDLPYVNLGKRLKQLRTQKKQSIEEVSGAVEIDVEQLHTIEAGTIRPAEDILLLLISHFGVQEEQANDLWDMAGYSTEKANTNTQDEVVKPMIMMPLDNRILYTDVVNITVNDYGVIMNFMQTNQPNAEATPVARIGMSKEHARSVIEILEQTMRHNEQHQQKRLQPPADDTTHTQ